MPVTLEQVQRALTGRYRVLSELGRGGMAAVFRAEDERHGRRVALKVLEPELAAAIGAERFTREIRITAQLSHPHIVPLFDSGEVDGLCYYVMPEVEGETLGARLAREPQLPVEEALRITREVAAALGYAHARGLVHRDVKPENIFLTPEHALLSDFGIARLAGTGPLGRMTTTGVMVGTPAYMSPEQAGGGSALDARSDQYALACVTYEMLAGQPPFTGPSAETVAHQHLVTPPRPVTDLRPKVSRGIAEALERALSKSPADRFASAEDLARALGAGAAEPAATAGPAAPSVPAARGRRALRVAIAVLVPAAIATAVGVAWWRGRDLGLERLPPGAKPAWILVAAFDGPAGDPEIAVAARQLVCAEIDQSRIMATVPPDQIALALKQAEKPDTTRITPAVARELAYRRSIRAVVEGSVARLGHGFTIAVRVSDVERDSTLVSEKAEARDESDLIRALSGLGRSVRRRLGENSRSVRSTRGVLDAQTPSFEAFRLAMKWLERVQVGDWSGGIRYARRALALDPQFAQLMCGVSGTYGNLGMADSAYYFAECAARLPERLSEEARYRNAAQLAEYRGDCEASLQAYEQWAREFPGSTWALANYAFALATFGRVREAYDENQRSTSLAPFGPSAGELGNNISYLLALGRIDQADRATDSLARMEGMSDAAKLYHFCTLSARERWASADSMATSRLDDPRLDASARGGYQMARFGTKSAMGEFRAAMVAARLAAGAAGKVGDRVTLLGALRAQAILAEAVPHIPQELPRQFPEGSSYADCITAGLLRAAAGDIRGARDRLHGAMQDSVARLGCVDHGRALLESWIASSEERWPQAAAFLAPAALRGFEFTAMGQPGVGLSTVNWFLGRAFEKSGQPDSAIAHYEQALRFDFSTPVCRVPARIRLVELYLARGDLESARRHWNILARDVTNPDPELRPMLSQAHEALVSAEAMARPAKQ